MMCNPSFSSQIYLTDSIQTLAGDQPARGTVKHLVILITPSLHTAEAEESRAGTDVGAESCVMLRACPCSPSRPGCAVTEDAAALYALGTRRGKSNNQHHSSLAVRSTATFVKSLVTPKWMQEWHCKG